MGACRGGHGVLLAAAVIVAVPASVLLTLANDYRPLGYGGTFSLTLAYPGLPAGHGIRTVNAFGGVREDFYIPPQRGTFYLFVSIMNTGSRAVIIESVSLPKGSLLRQAGQALYARPGGGNGAIAIPPAKRAVHDVTLGHYQEILAAIPVRSWPCTSKPYFWVTVPSFDVTYRFAIFRHVAALPWGHKDDMIIMHAPFGKQGQPGVVCVK